MEKLTAFLTAMTMVSFAVIYVRKILQSKSSPALMTWVTFLLGTGASLVSYLIAENRDVISGILNTMDVLVVLSIIIAILVHGNVHGNRKKLISTFEISYIFIISCVVIYGYINRDAWNTNVWIQVIITIGYWPTFHKMWQEKKNTEPFMGWSLNFLAATIALYPALSAGNTLAVIYASRTLACTTLVMLVMAYYEVRKRQNDQGD